MILRLARLICLHPAVLVAASLAWIILLRSAQGAAAKSYNIAPGENAEEDESMYLGPPPDFKDNGDGSVTDSTNKIMWEKGDDQNKNPHTWGDAAGYCDTLRLAGHADWRLPLNAELLKLMKDGDQDPSIDTRYFPNCHSRPYWSGNNNPSNPNLVWAMDFSNGRLCELNRYRPFCVRCARDVQ